MSVNNDEHSGRPSIGTMTENVAKVWKAILEDRRWTLHGVYTIVKLSYVMCLWILSYELNVWHIAAKFVPRLVSNDQKEHHIAICSDLKEQFVSTVITGNESWVCGYDRDKATVISVEGLIFTVTKGNTTTSNQCQIRCWLFFFLPWRQCA
jgi:ABC-type antimicrobial peptide transport system permease subunit